MTVQDWLVRGQSNRKAVHANQGTVTPDSRVQVWDPVSSSFVTATLGASPFNSDGSLPSSLWAALLWVQDHPSDTVRIVFAPISGQPVEYWLVTDPDNPPAGWVNLVGLVEGARAQAGEDFTFSVYYTCGHEADQNVDPERFLAMDDAVTQQLLSAGYITDTTFKIISEPIQNFTGSGENEQQIGVRLRQLRRDRYTAVVAAVNLTADPAFGSPLHFDFASQQELGEREYRALLNLPHEVDRIAETTVVTKALTRPLGSLPGQFANPNAAMYAAWQHFTFRCGAKLAPNDTGQGPIFTVSLPAQADFPLVYGPSSLPFINILNDASRFALVGAAPVGNQPAYTGTYATDLAALKAWLPTWVVITGASAIGLNGLELGLIENVLFIGDGTHASLVCGAVNSAFPDAPGGRVTLRNVAFVNWTKLDVSAFGADVNAPGGLVSWYGKGNDEIVLGAGGRLSAPGLSLGAPYDPVAQAPINGVAFRGGGLASIPNAVIRGYDYGLRSFDSAARCYAKGLNASGAAQRDVDFTLGGEIYLDKYVIGSPPPVIFPAPVAPVGFCYGAHA